jgi:hypothetical protein
MRILLALALASAPAFAQRYRGGSMNDDGGLGMEGVYAGIGGGAGFNLVSDFDNGFGYDGELRFGYSFNPALQLYLTGQIDGATIQSLSYRMETVGVSIQYHLFARRGLGVYGRATIGVALSSSFNPDPTSGSAAGLCEGGGLGMEIGVSPGLFVAPELFYKNTTLNIPNGGGSVGIQVVGLSLSLIYY